MPYSWEILALLAAAAGLWLHKRKKWSPPTPASWESRRWDWILAAGCALVGGVSLFVLWGRTATHLAPSGADFEGYYLGAMAFERDSFDLYVLDRYPGFPWLASLFASSPQTIHRAGALVNMFAISLAAIPLYFVGRSLGGRAAGVLGALLALRMSVVLDLGHSFTHYPLAAATDCLLLALLLSLVRTRCIWTALGMGAAGALAVSCDPKQAVFVLGVFGVGLLGVVTGKQAIRKKIIAAVLLFLPLVLLNQAVMRLPVELFSLEEVATRVQLHFEVTEALRQAGDTGFRLGEPWSLFKLPGSLWLTATGLSPEAGQPGVIAPLALEAMPVVYGNTSMWWVLLFPALLVSLALKREEGWWLRLLACLLPLVMAWPVFHMHYQHRYFLGAAMILPPLVVAGFSRWAGGLPLLLAGAVTLVFPTSPFSSVDESYLQRKEHRHDIWVGPEHGADLETLAWAQESLPEDAVVYDLSERRPSAILSASHPYVRCNQTDDACAQQIVNQAGTRVAVLWAGEFLSGQLPGGPGTPPTRAEEGEGIPTSFGECWEQVRWLNPDAGVFQYNCDTPPIAHPRRTPPPPEPRWHSRF